jgi:hypothetical protein
LWLDKDALIKRLRRRAFGFLGMERFALEAIDRCIHAFDNYVTETKVYVGGMKAGEVAGEINKLL